ncbi:MAG: 50S ribosomal protein L24 [Acidimicrobiia bacterium]|jgi:large subunit ribosomal protein L24|nr:50S ribosomal protein L24 [Acidimicrobiia bacterium]
MKIKKGDRVVVLSGKDRGKEGVVMRAIPKDDKVIVEGVNVAKKHQRPTRMTMQGGIIDKDMPLHVSNVAIISPGDGKPTRVAYRFDDDGQKIRICRRTGAELQ